MSSLAPFTKVALRVARQAGALLQAASREEIEVSCKGVRNLVTNVDRASEALIVRTLLRHFPTHRILAEEGHAVEAHAGASPRSRYRWLIDPLDGTTNYAHRFPFYCVSIALEVEDVVRLGVVYDPIRRECFSAEAGAGAQLNGRPIAVSSTPRLQNSLLVTGFSADIQTNPDNNFDRFRQLSLTARAVRRTGSAALDLCYVAAGRSDGFWEMNLHPWDTAAGSLIVTEAGGRVSRFSGRHYKIDAPDILATNSRIHPAMVRALGKNGGKSAPLARQHPIPPGSQTQGPFYG